MRYYILILFALLAGGTAQAEQVSKVRNSLQVVNSTSPTVAAIYFDADAEGTSVTAELKLIGAAVSITSTDSLGIYLDTDSTGPAGYLNLYNGATMFGQVFGVGTDGAINLGGNDTGQGSAQLYGDSSTNGGSVALWNAASEDAVASYYRLFADGDYLRIGAYAGGFNDRFSFTQDGDFHATGTAQLAGLTASRAVVTDANKELVSSATTAAELAFVNGVTSNIQTQLNSITGGGVTSLTGDVTGTGPGATAATIANDAVTLGKMADMATASLLGRNTGGTGNPEVLSASTVRTLLGLVIGTNVQAYDADLTTWAGVTPSANGQSLVASATYATMRTLMTLGTADTAAFNALSIGGGLMTVNSGGTISGASWSISSAGAGVLTTLNTGQGVNELFDMDQNVQTTDNVAFGSVAATQASIGTAALTVTSTATNDDPSIRTIQGRASIASTNGTVLTYATTTNKTIVLEARVYGRAPAGGDGLTTGDAFYYHIEATFKNISGTVTQVGSTTLISAHESIANTDANFSISGANILVRASNAAAGDAEIYHCDVEVREVGS